MHPPTPFHLDVDREGRKVVITGEPDDSARSSVTDSTAEFNEIGPGNIDLDAVTLLDASAVGTIAAADNEKTKPGSVLTVRARNRLVGRVFALGGLGAQLDRSRRNRPDRSGPSPRSSSSSCRGPAREA